jgi:flagella basal body P-ring formation protein FlgA
MTRNRLKPSRIRLLAMAAAVLAIEFGALATGGAVAAAATLRPNVVVHGDTVRLRDIFDGAGEHADAVLFRAPAPGQSIVLPTRWLHQVARTYKLDWRPAPGLDEGRLARSSNRVGPEIIVAALTRALAARTGPSQRFDLSLDNPTLEIHLPIEQPANVVVKNLHFDARSKRFAAIIKAPDDRSDAVAMQVAGRVHALTPVPVLINQRRNGDTIRDRDVELQYRRIDGLDRDAVTSLDDIVGKSARHTLPPGRTVGTRDIREPQLVRRGRMVVMKYETSNMSITAHGTARENGTKGDSVRIRNSNSGKIVEAVVTGPDSVAVLPLTNSGTR